jgi:hypothetical protein
MHEQEFIQAIYSFYFVLETAYGDGKFKKSDVLTRFKAAETLRQATEKTLRDPECLLMHEKRARKVFQEKFSCMTVDQYLEYVVDLRGFLHHHTVRRSGIWHPEDQRVYEIDAIVLQSVAFNAIFQMTWPYFEDPEVLSQYETQFSK